MKIASGGIKSKRARVDISLEFGNENQKIKSAIELKFLKKRTTENPITDMIFSKIFQILKHIKKTE